MNILLLINKPPFPPKDGGSIATMQVITGLASQKHTIHVFYLNTSSHAADVDQIPETLKQNITFTAVKVETTIRHIAAIRSLVFSSVPYTVLRFANGESRQALIHILLSETFDLIQIEGLAMVQYLPLLKNHSQAKIVFRPHNVEFIIWKMLASAENRPFRKLYFYLLSRQIRRYESAMAGQFSALLPISEDDAAIFRRWAPGASIMALPFGVETKSTVPKPLSPIYPVLLFLGALDWQPNINGLFWFLKKVWPHLVSQNSKIIFRIAGRNPDKRLVQFINKINRRKDANTLTGTPRIDFLGEIDSVTDFYASGSIFIIPLFAGSGIRIKILEAMAMQRLVISTSTGAAGLSVQHSKNILIADHPKAFVREIESILTDKEQYRKIIKNALTLLRERFDKHRIIENLGKFYTQL